MSQATSPVILIVDDHPRLRKILEAQLVAAGYAVHLAEGGREALSQFAQVRPNLMVLDLNMPGMDGFQVLETLYVRGFTEKVGIMVLTGRNEIADVKRAMRLGARDFMTKPLEADVFLTRIERLLQAAPPR